ncbi:MAG: phosphoribosyltransferase [Deltaproteobacteria bacterium]|nr:phosphoribosyltransferase [Deltaproteobacteria bacterium]MCW5801648.1 phosphoribosyltransferase [Deltaproteobacteria bacterium]
MRRFVDRREAGRLLSDRLSSYVGRPDVAVLALPRGGVPVAFEIATRLGAPLDVLVVKKLGVPGREELAMGAVASGGIRVVDEHLVRALRIPDDVLAGVETAARAELERREREFRDDLPQIDVEDKTAILIDDGLATGASMAAAIVALRTRSPVRIVVAVPVAPRETCAALSSYADQVICLITPEPLYAVGLWYEDFEQVSDTEVRELLDAARRARTAAASSETTAPPQH